MSTEDLLQDSAEELFEEAPCGYLSTELDGLIMKVNRTFERWTGYTRDELLGRRRFQELLSPGGRIYHETHYAPLLRMQGAVREIAVEIVRQDGSRLPALVNSVLRSDPAGQPRVIRTTVFDATERRGYEQELLSEKRRIEDVAQRLQRSMLSGELPAAGDLELEVAYRPAVRGLEIGGDWYDAFWLDDGRRLALVVGDVVGRGIEAAATMGQLRSAVRALASTNLEPAELLSALERYAERHGIGTMATFVYADLDLSTRTLRHAAAGHPPPLLVEPGAEPSFLWEGRSLPVAAEVGQASARDQACRTLRPDSTLLLYSDGLIERRASSLPDDMQRLTAEVAAGREDDVSQLASRLVRELPDPDHPDDLCLLIVRLGGSSAAGGVRG